MPGTALRGTVQNDILKEYIARGNYIYPPRPSMRLTTDLFAYAAERIELEHDLDLRLPHPRGRLDCGELAFTLANGIAYAQAAVDAGLSPDEFGARLSFFFNAHNHFFQEVAKFRAARRLWATIMRDRFGATNPKALALRFHAQTGGSTLTAQQPENNIVRVAIQALSAVAGVRRACTRTASTRRSRSRASTRRGSRCARSRSSLPRAAPPTRRPARRLLLHRGAHRRARAARPRADRADRRARRRRGGGRAGLRPA